jgi:hypothetical protein
LNGRRTKKNFLLQFLAACFQTSNTSIKRTKSEKKKKSAKKNTPSREHVPLI